MSQSGIYKITSPTGNIYIGQSVNIKYRWRQYRKLYNNIKNQRILYRSFVKYGVDNHTFEVIEECDANLLNDREYYWQEHYNVLGNKGLNCVLVSDSNSLVAGGIKQGKLVFNTETGVFYSSVKEAAFSINKKGIWLTGRFSGRTINNTPFIMVDSTIPLKKTRVDVKGNNYRDKKLRKLKDFPPLKIYNLPSHCFGFKWDHKESIHFIMKKFLNSNGIRDYDFVKDNGWIFGIFMMNKYKGTALYFLYETYIKIAPKKRINLLVKNIYN